MKASICLKINIKAKDRQDAEAKLGDLLLKIFAVWRDDENVISVEQAFKELPDELPDEGE